VSTKDIAPVVASPTPLNIMTCTPVELEVEVKLTSVGSAKIFMVEYTVKEFATVKVEAVIVPRKVILQPVKVILLAPLFAVTLFWKV